MMSARLSLAAAFISFLAPLLSAAPVEIVPPDLRGAAQPQVAMAPSGRIHVVFGKDNAIFHTTSPDGRAFSEPVKIGELEKLALKMRRGPRVTATDKLVLVTAISHSDGNVHAWTSADTGRTWKDGAHLNTVAKSAREGLQALAGDGRGLVAAVWLDMRGKGMEPWIRVSRDGGVTWADEVSIYQSPDGHICECCVPAVAISPAGEIAAMWRNWLGGSRDIYMSTSRDGRAFSPAQKLGAGTWKLNACPMDGGSLAFAPTGKWLAVWRRERTVFATDAMAPEKQLAANATQPVAAYAGKTPLTLWEANGALMLQRGTESPARFAENAAAASIVSGSDSAVVAWEGTLDGAKTILLDRVR
jgi:BNR repeat-like domain